MATLVHTSGACCVCVCACASIPCVKRCMQAHEQCIWRVGSIVMEAGCVEITKKSSVRWGRGEKVKKGPVRRYETYERSLTTETYHDFSTTAKCSYRTVSIKVVLVLHEHLVGVVIGGRSTPPQVVFTFAWKLFILA